MKNNLLTLAGAYGVEPRQQISPQRISLPPWNRLRSWQLKESIALPGDAMNFSHTLFLKECGFSVCVPMKTESNEVLGMVALSPHSPTDNMTRTK